MMATAQRGSKMELGTGAGTSVFIIRIDTEHIAMKVFSLIIFLLFFRDALGFKGTSLRLGYWSTHRLSLLHVVDDADELLYKPVSNKGERGK